MGRDFLARQYLSDDELLEPLLEGEASTLLHFLIPLTLKEPLPVQSEQYRSYCDVQGWQGGKSLRET